MKKFIFLSNATSLAVQIYNLRIVSKKYDVEIEPCKHIFEMLDKCNSGIKTILIDENYSLDLPEELKEKLCTHTYFLSNNVIKNFANEIMFDSYEKFFENIDFQVKDIDKSQNFEAVVTQKLKTLGVAVNSWQSRFIKYVLLEMQKQGISEVNKNFIELCARKNQINCKNVYDAIRPTLKQYVVLMQQKNLTQSTAKVTTIFNELYEYITKN